MQMHIFCCCVKVVVTLCKIEKKTVVRNVLIIYGLRYVFDSVILQSFCNVYVIMYL